MTIITTLVSPGEAGSDGILGQAARSDHIHPTVAQWPAIPKDFLFDALIDTNNYALGPEKQTDSVFDTIAEALVLEGMVSIAVKEAGDVDPITVTSGMALQRLQGKDADTTVLPVSVTCLKDNVTIEQLGITSLLEIRGGSAANILMRQQVQNCLVSGSGVLKLGTGAGAYFAASASFIRFNVTTTTIPLVIGLGGSSLERSSVLSDLDFYLTSGIGPSSFMTFEGGQPIYELKIDRATFVGTVPAFSFAASTYLVRPRMDKMNQFGVAQTTLVLTSGAIAQSQFQGLLSISSPAGTDIRTRVVSCTLSGGFECTSADADAAGLILAFNSAPSSATIKGSQDAVWIGNDFQGCTINFQSKTGIVVLGGDMTGATLQNVPADIVFRSVKGQTDRGVYDGGTWSADLLPTTTNLYDLGVTGTRWKNLWLSGTATIAGALSVSGATTIANLLFSPDNTYDIGQAGLVRPRDFNLGRNAYVGGILSVTGNTTLATLDSTTHLPVADNTSDLGSAAKSWRDLFLDRNALIGGTLGVTGATSLTGTLAVTATATVRDITPQTASTYNLGSFDGRIWNFVLANSVIGSSTSATAPLVGIQNTLGNEVLNLSSVATGDDPTMAIRQGRIATTDATVTTLFTHTIPASTTVQILAFVTARRTGGVLGTAEDGAGYFIQATVKNVAGTATLIGANVPIGTQESQVLWDAIVDVSGATARVRVTGAAQNNVAWNATVLIMKVGT